MSTESTTHELSIIMAKLKGDSSTRLAAIHKFGQLGTSDLKIVLALEQIALKDPEPEIQEAALEVLSLPQHQRVHRNLSSLNDYVRKLLPDEIDLWAKQQIISPQLTRLLKGRLGVGPITPPIRPIKPSPTGVEREMQPSAAQPALASTPVVPVAPQPAQIVAAPALKAPRKEAVPFDQWLLSERNIKFALYTGGSLLVLAGIIFISVNWMRIPGPAKFAVTLLVTGLMYLGGYLLFQKPMLRIGGIALLGVASGFLPLNFAVLQIYVLGPHGLADDVMWLIASPMCLLLYLLTSYWTRNKLFTFISLAAIVSTIWAALVVGAALSLVYPLVFALAVLGMLILARFFQSTPLENFTRLPLLIVVHIGMPLMILWNLTGWAYASVCVDSSYRNCAFMGSPWLGLLGLVTGGLFYLAADRLFKSWIPRWVAAFLFCGIIFLVLVELDARWEIYHYTFLAVPLIYLGIGYAINRREKKSIGALPLYFMAGLVALIATFAAAISTILITQNPADLARALFTDVLLLVAIEFLLGIKAARWLTVFLFPAAFYLALKSWHFKPLALGITLMLLALIYLGGGYALKLWEKRKYGHLPFYFAAYAIAIFATLLVVNESLPLMIVLYLDVVLLVATNILLKRIEARWVTAFLFPVPFSLSLDLLHFSQTASGIALMILALAYMGGGYALERWEKRKAYAWPLYAAAYAIAIFTTLLVVDKSLPLMIVLYLEVVLLIATNILLKRIEARWVAAFLFPVPFSLSLGLLNFSQTASGIALMILALAYMGGGYALERWEKRKAYAWPLYAAAYVIALLVTAQAIPKTTALIEVLFGDVILLIVSAAIHRIYWWVYGAAWLFILPIYLTIQLLVKGLPDQGLLMGLLGLIYTAAGYVLGRRALRLGVPFLSGAAFLSLVAVTLSWVSHPIASMVLAIVAILYLLAALWLVWPWLLSVTWMAVNLLCVSMSLIFFKDASLFDALVISSATLGAILLAGGLSVQRKVSMHWGLPLLVGGTVNLVGAYLAGLILGEWLAIGLSALLALYLLAFAWLMRAWIKVPILTYLGLGVVIIGYFLTIGMLGGQPALKVWPVYAAALCCLFVLLAWLLRREPLIAIYSQPLRWVGLCALVAPMAGSVFLFEMPVFIAIAFAIATLTYLGDAALRRILGLAYIGLATLVVTIWAGLAAVKVDELQAFVFPLSLVQLGVGWNEHARDHRLAYRLLSLLGLVLLMGSAYYQSLVSDNIFYTILLLVESLLALAWGIWQHTRTFVQVGGIALLVNGVTQLGPGFVDLDRWIQIAVIGGLLFGLGLAALFKRQEILMARKKLSNTWRQWEP